VVNNFTTATKFTLYDAILKNIRPQKGNNSCWRTMQIGPKNRGDNRGAWINSRKWEAPQRTADLMAFIAIQVLPKSCWSYD